MERVDDRVVVSISRALRHGAVIFPVVNEQLESILVDSFESVVHYAEAHGVNNRIAAYMLAIDRVAFAIKLRGLYA